MSVYAVCREKELLETPIFWGATTTEAISCVVEEFKHTIDVTSECAKLKLLEHKQNNTKQHTVHLSPRYAPPFLTICVETLRCHVANGPWWHVEMRNHPSTWA